MKKIKSKISIFIIVVIALFVVLSCIFKAVDNGPRKVKSAARLEAIYDYGNTSWTEFKQIVYGIFAFPWVTSDMFYHRYYTSYGVDDYSYSGSGLLGRAIESTSGSAAGIDSVSGSSKGSNKDTGNSSNDFSTTNIQVENVDEADVIKTDGEYIYSLSDNKVIITDATNPESPVIVNRLSSASFSTSAPEEILLYKNKLVVIGTMSPSKTTVEVYDMTSKTNPVKLESYSVNGSYYTSRLTNGKLYVISTGSLKYGNKKVDNSYTENNATKYISYNDIYYFKNKATTAQTTISTLDLDKDKDKVDISSYLLSLENIYVSENNMYLVAENYSNEDYNFFKIAARLLGPRGIIGEAFRLENDDWDYYSDEETTIHKLELNNGKIKYVGAGKAEGNTIDQFSLDEYDSNLRVALHSEEGSRVAIFNNKMKLIGETDYLAKKKKMYSSRFIGNRGYLVTYLNTDPLFTIDLSNPKHPEVLGELQISGYSTYLHPYDENHLIGIGYESEVRTNRNSQGKVTSSYAVITGMKMALFDVSNIDNPVMISNTKIGSASTRSAILTNHKALLFSKEKGVIAIPVNTYVDDLDITLNTEEVNLDTVASSYTSKSKSYKTEGYLVYGINLEEGFKARGFIEHEGVDVKSYSGTNLIRGVYIKDWLFTVSQGMVKVNDLNTLEEISSVLVKEEK